MARLVGIPYFFTEQALAEEKVDMASIRRAKTTLSDGTPDDQAHKLCCAQISVRMHKQFDNRNICRSASSKDWQGKPLLELKAPEIITLKLPLLDWEQKIVDNLCQQVAER